MRYGIIDGRGILVLGGLDWSGLVLDDANLIPHDKLSYVQRMIIVSITISV